MMDWEMLSDAQRRWLTLNGYIQLKRDVRKERIRIEQERGRSGWASVQSDQIQKFKSAYPMNRGALVPALTQFAQGQLAENFRS